MAGSIRSLRSPRPNASVAFFEQAAAAAGDLSALIVALVHEDYDTADTWLEAAKDKLTEIDGAHAPATDRSAEGFRTPALCRRAGLDAGPASESLVRRKPRVGKGAVWLGAARPMGILGSRTERWWGYAEISLGVVRITGIAFG